MARICVVGLGKIGLPLAIQCTTKGHTVIGVDVNPRVVSTVQSGFEPFPGEPLLAERLAAAVREETFRATTETAVAVRESDVVLVAVPLVVDESFEPNFAIIDEATIAVAPGLHDDVLVSYETTLPIGTTRQRLAPMLERISDMVEGRDFFVCHSPERVSCGSIFADLSRYPKLVGALNPEGSRHAMKFYESVIDFEDRPDLSRPNGVWDMGSAEAAEFTKLAETTYRNVNIAYANELAMSADTIGVDIVSVIEAANSQPYSYIHSPGIAVGGHCIPVYPHLLFASSDHTTVARQAIVANEQMPAYAVSLLEAILDGDLGGLRVVVLGASYRGGVKELSFSGVFPTVEVLERLGADVVIHDPLFDDAELAAAHLPPYRLGTPCDAAIVQAAHSEYRLLSPDDLPGIRAVVDGRNVLDPTRWSGVAFRRLGSVSLEDRD